ncbi:MAG: hypothetical protein A2798_00875 [Candidatus Levybacteria bacterium RIFCSPHIGHO2_01_FULL_37_17]|nr:MAG: hypothetical protein A2798_00875 [Candidatus Levybacteria bacterium RIFCSPHIGHO2_01_FULL_37_17]OGH37004.1 MAG: hypothetical protein A2959_01735 [Candidatus Levybacteria bacterium RIFCSPLOWO2_01_FULL_38_23]
MPVIKSAKKKLRKDILREKRNDLIRNSLKQVLKQIKNKPTAESIKKAIKIADKAAKKNIIHKNKASRIKSRLSKLVKNKNTTSKPSKAKK